MQDNVGIVRNEAEMLSALEDWKKLEARAERWSNRSSRV